MSIRDESVKSVAGSDFEGGESPIFIKSIEAFRGFEEPKVVLERLAVTPPPVPKPKSILKDKSKFTSANKLFQQCTVRLLNQDLAKLKYLYSKKPELLKSLKKSAMSYKCNICEKEYKSERRLVKHHGNKHVLIYKPEKPKSQKRVSFSEKIIVHEVKEYHKCRKCSRAFESYVLLKAHTKEQHRKRKCYICNFCSKNFVDRTFFKVHIKLHCEACGQLFPNKAKCNLHRRLICRSLKPHECKLCSARFFHIMDLKNHSYDHVENYICDICKDECMSKCALAHHIYFLHSRKHKKKVTMLYKTRKLGNENLYLCKFCDESSVEKDLIEEHVNKLPDLMNRAMAGYIDYYFCDQCMKNFDTEQDMLQHKWSHFLKTPEYQPSEQTEIQIIKPVLKQSYNVNEEIPMFLKPKLVLDKIIMSELKKPASKIVEKDLKESQDPELPVSQSTELPVSQVTEPVSLETELSIPQATELPAEEPVLPDSLEYINSSVQNPDTIDYDNLKKPAKAAAETSKCNRKTIMSKHQCENCGKYFSTGYTLRRHIESQHMDFENLRCKVCEEVFVWPSLLQKHKCIRLHIPEMPFDDARPEIHFDNLSEIPYSSPDQYQSNTVTSTQEMGFDDLNINEIDDYMNSVDFDIPEPIVEFNDSFVHSSAVVNPSVTSSLTQSVATPNVSSILPQRLGQVPESACVSQGIGLSPTGSLMDQSVEHLSPNTSELDQNDGQLTQSVSSLNNSMIKVTHFESNGYRLIMQEVPIEF